MRSNLQIQLEDAYQLVLEGKGTPCPCTMGKKCMKNKRDCKDCKAALKESHDDEDHKEKLLSDPKMQQSMSILNQYAQGDITNLEAAQMFKDLYEKGADHGPTQDDMYYTND